MTGYSLLGHTGAASGGVADTFREYGVFCPLFWFGLSWCLGFVYVRAVAGNNPRWLFCYVGFICATHWLVSQGFAASFVPLMYFQIVPIAVFTVLRPTSPVSQPASRAARALPPYPAAARPAQS